MIDYYDEQGNIIFINREWQQVLGWSLEDLRERGTQEFYRSILPDEEYRKSVFKHMAKWSLGWHNLKIRREDASEVETSWITIRLSNGKSIGIGQDITD